MESILIVEDNLSVSENLGILLSKNGYNCYFAFTLENAYKILKQKEISLCLLDVALPDGNSLFLCETIRKQKNLYISIIFVTADDKEETVVKGFEAGGDDYVVKPFRSRELVARIHALLRKKQEGETITKSKLITGDLAVDLEEYTVCKIQEKIDLRPLEFKLLEQLLKAEHCIVRREYLLDKLWDQFENYVEENTLSVHVSRLRSKLGFCEGKAYFETIWGIGYRWILPIRYQ